VIGTGHGGFGSRVLLVRDMLGLLVQDMLGLLVR
jgi:hypothetical protein